MLMFTIAIFILCDLISCAVKDADDFYKKEKRYWSNKMDKHYGELEHYAKERTRSLYKAEKITRRMAKDNKGNIVAEEVIER